MAATSIPAYVWPVVSEATTSHTASATNAAATVTLAADDDYGNGIAAGVAWSYSAAPTGGKLTIAAGGSTVFEVDITAAGPGYVPWVGRTQTETALTVTLAAGGAAVVGKVSVYGVIKAYDPNPAS